MKLNEGMIQIYTGNGKGKTTAAIGQGIRAYGNGLKVIMVQFLKGGKTGELSTIEKLGENFRVFRFEKERDFIWNLSEEEKSELKKEIRLGFEFVKEVIKENVCDVLILDEIMGALQSGYVKEEEVIDILPRKPKSMEIILTGRNVPDGILQKSDLVTEMKLVKHYFKNGIGAREGIEY